MKKQELKDKARKILKKGEKGAGELDDLLDKYFAPVWKGVFYGIAGTLITIYLILKPIACVVRKLMGVDGG